MEYLIIFFANNRRQVHEKHLTSVQMMTVREGFYVNINIYTRINP